MPRLSVDIDLTYLLLSGRDEALVGISLAMEAIAHDVTERIAGSNVQIKRVNGMATKLVVTLKDAQIKVEPNQVLRGSVYPPERMDICANAQSLFGQFVSVQALSFADLYGGKICAALDRQHPRDLYDVCLLLENEGFIPAVRRAFVVYLASHGRPMQELLIPQLKDISKVYASEFAGMAREDISIEVLCKTRERLVNLIREELDSDEKRFLLSIKQGEPEWETLGFSHLKELPALQWKLMNIRRMNKRKHTEALDKLKEILR